MAVVTIPFDYDEHSHPGVVPICISDVDARGNVVYRGWIDCVEPVAEKVVAASERLLGDPWRGSEIAEYAVHAASRTNGPNLGARPDLKILSNSIWRALDLRVGGRRNRRLADVELFSKTVEAIQDEYDHARQLDAVNAVDQIRKQLLRTGRLQEVEMIEMVLRNAPSEEMVSHFGKSRNTITQQFYRGVRRAAKQIGLTWR